MPRAKKRHVNHVKVHRSKDLAKDVEEVFRAMNHKDLSSPFSQGLLDLLTKFPLSKLTKLDLEGRISLSAFQIMAGNAPELQELYLTNSPVTADTKTLSDEWLEALVAVNPLRSIRRMTLRLDNDQTVESGSFSERGLVKFLTHCQHHSPRLSELVGEFTRIPDKILEEKTAAFVKAGLRRLSVRNAVPYRRFENTYETERHYNMNPGFHAMMAGHAHQQHQHHHQHHLAANAVEGGVPEGQGHPAGQEQGQEQCHGSAKGRRRFQGYVFRPYPKPRPLDEDGSGLLVGED